MMSPAQRTRASAPWEWSVQQQRIFDWFASGQGNLVVRARAGTGKTTTIVEALNYASDEPNVLLAAFNKRIATELQARVNDDVQVKTLHALGFAYLTQQWQGVRVDTSVDDDRAREACGHEAPAAIVVLVKKLAALLKGCAPFGGLQEACRLALDYECEPDHEWQQRGWTLNAVASLAIAARDAAQTRDPLGRISYDDMIYVPLALDFARPRFTLVVIDEAQDMNASQLLLAQRACVGGGRIVVVGDDRQAIYGFRGADTDGIDRLKAELGATELGLTTTYRCPKVVVALANEVVPDFEAAPTAPEGVVDSVDVDDIYSHAQPGAFILSRKNAPLMPLCLKLLRYGTPARIEGRDFATGLKTIVRKLRARSVPDFITAVSKWELFQLEKLQGRPNAGPRMELVRDQAETLVALAEGCESVVDVLAGLDALFIDSDSRTRRNQVICSSVHKAKGLEADRVFVLRSTIRRNNREEENIYYVAVTRAKKHLTWVEGKL